MERYQIILAYDGTGFVGSQRQTSTALPSPSATCACAGAGRTGNPGAESRTVQGELEKALRRLGRDKRTVYLAGRTDSGTHASGQVAAFDLDWQHSLEDLRKALNANLPADMAVWEVKIAAAEFRPRFDATSRCYRYRLFCQGVRDPLRERYAWRVWPPVADLTPLAKIWPGAHDFAAFGSPPKHGGSTVRTVHFAEWHNHGNEWTFEIQADAFLYRMVRRLVYVQVAVGQGRIQEETLVRALQGKPGASSRGVNRGIQDVPASIAPASGLTLVEVRYDNLV